MKKRFVLNEIHDGVIYTEQKALDALYSNSTCNFLVEVLRTGPVNPVYSYVDIEGCIVDLDTFIHTAKLPFEVQNNIWVIMYHIMSGLEFIHGRNWIHRAIVPSSSTSLIILRVLTLISSSFLGERPYLENWVF